MKSKIVVVMLILCFIVSSSIVLSQINTQSKIESDKVVLNKKTIKKKHKSPKKTKKIEFLTIIYLNYIVF